MTTEQQKLAMHLISEIEVYMDDKDFQRSFFESLAQQFHDKNYLSQKQMDSLNRIYERVTAL